MYWSLFRTKSTESDIVGEAWGDARDCSGDEFTDELTKDGDNPSDDSDDNEDDADGDGLLESDSSNRDAGGCDAVNDMALADWRRGFHRSDSVFSVTETLHSTTRHISVTLIITTETDLQRLVGWWLACQCGRIFLLQRTQLVFFHGHA